jgi:outer membrane protein TolC
MKLNKKMFASAVSGFLALIFVAGCMDEESFYSDVRSSRTASYNQWEQMQRQSQAQAVQISGKLTVEDAVKLALMNNNELMVAVEQREVARGVVLESYSEVLPSVSVLGGYVRKDEVSGFTVGDRKVTMGELDNYSADLVVRQPIYRGGAISSALRAAKLYSLFGDEQVRSQVQKTIYETASAYFDVLLAGHLYRVNEDAVKSAQAQLADIKAKRSEGLASEFDILRAEVDVSNFRAEMIGQKNQISIATTRLLKAMGVSAGGQVELAEELRYEQGEAPSINEVVRAAYENNPDLYLSEYELRMQKEAVETAKSDFWPQVNGVFTQGWSRPDPHSAMLDRWGDYWTAGVMVEWPLFSGFGREGRLIQARALYRQKQHRLRDAEQRVFLEAQRELLNLQNAKEFVESQNMNLRRAEEGLRLAEVGFREGVNTQVEIIDARAALTRASGLYYQSLHQHTMARLNLQHAMGVLGPRAGEKQITARDVQPAGLAESIRLLRIESGITEPNELSDLHPAEN